MHFSTSTQKLYVSSKHHSQHACWATENLRNLDTKMAEDNVRRVGREQVLRTNLQKYFGL